jgi:hypothetical protein
MLQDLSASDVVDIYNSGSDNWLQGTLSQARHSLAAASLNHLAIFAGGDSSTGASMLVDIWDSIANSWRTATLGAPRFNLAGAALPNRRLAFFGGGRVIVAGQRSVSSDLVDIYDSSQDSWTTATLSNARHHVVAAASSERVLFFGGDQNGAGAADTVDGFEQASGSWDVFGHLPWKSEHGCAVGVPGGCYFAGGESDSTGVHNWVMFYANGVSSASAVGNLSSPKESLAAGVFYNGSSSLVLFAGGALGNATSFDTVDVFPMDFTLPPLTPLSSTPVPTFSVSPISSSPAQSSSSALSTTPAGSFTPLPTSPFPSVSCPLPPPDPLAACASGVWVIPRSVQNIATFTVPGPTIINGSYTQRPGATLLLTRSTAPLVVVGCASLSGTLQLSLQLTVGTQATAAATNITVLQAPCFSGRFSNITLAGALANCRTVDPASQAVTGEALSVVVQLDPSCSGSGVALIIAMACLCGTIVLAALIIFLLLFKYNDRFRMFLRGKPVGHNLYSIQMEEPL